MLPALRSENSGREDRGEGREAGGCEGSPRAVQRGWERRVRGDGTVGASVERHVITGYRLRAHGHLFIYTFQRVISRDSRFRSHGGKSLLNSGRRTRRPGIKIHRCPVVESLVRLYLLHSARGATRRGEVRRVDARRGAARRERVRLKSNNQLKLREPQRAIVIINNFITQRRPVAHLNITSPLTVARSASERASQSRLRARARVGHKK